MAGVESAGGSSSGRSGRTRGGRPDWGRRNGGGLASPRGRRSRARRFVSGAGRCIESLAACVSGRLGKEETRGYVRVGVFARRAGGGGRGVAGRGFWGGGLGLLRRRKGIRQKEEGLLQRS